MEAPLEQHDHEGKLTQNLQLLDESHLVEHDWAQHKARQNLAHQRGPGAQEVQHQALPLRQPWAHTVVQSVSRGPASVAPRRAALCGAWHGSGRAAQARGTPRGGAAAAAAGAAVGSGGSGSAAVGQRTEEHGELEHPHHRVGRRPVRLHGLACRRAGTCVGGSVACVAGPRPLHGCGRLAAKHACLFQRGDLVQQHRATVPLRQTKEGGYSSPSAAARVPRRRRAPVPRVSANDTKRQEAAEPKGP